MNLEEAIEDLELLRRKIDPRILSPNEYREVGWLDRPLRQLIDSCREEREAISWAQLEPRLELPEPLPAQAEASP
ncbi:MAG TPA: hypothetical protein VFS67_30700 [Polyangiaceae bacterium]|nr:hypothetical protein [Polyangiaceae bacterium]